MTKNYHSPKFVLQKWARPKKRRQSVTSNRLFGTDVKPYSWNWVVQFSIGCGGSIINENWVVTTARVVNLRIPKKFKNCKKMKIPEKFQK